MQEPSEEEREQREAEFEEQLRARVVRSDLIGRDRHFRRYWWLQGMAPHMSPKAITSSFPENLQQTYLPSVWACSWAQQNTCTLGVMMGGRMKIRVNPLNIPCR